MGDDLSNLPLKSMQLPTKTVAKLKSLAVKTIADLYRVPLARLLDLGLSLREVEEIAEAAPDFGVAWHSKQEVEAAVASRSPLTPAPPNSKAKAAAEPASKGSPTKPSRNRPFPQDVEETFSSDARARIDVTGADFEHFAPYVDAAGQNFKTPPPSSRHFRLFRRMRVVRDRSIGGDERWYLVALADISQIPLARAAGLSTFLLHLANLIDDVVARIGRSGVHGHQLNGCAVTLPLLAKDRSKADRLAEAHARWVAEGPPFLLPLPKPYVSAAACGLVMAELFDDAIAMGPAILDVARGLHTPVAVDALRILCTAYDKAGRAAEGMVAVRPLLTKRTMEAAAGNGDALVAVARLCVGGQDYPLAITALQRAFALDNTPVHLSSLRAQVIDDARFEPLHGHAGFRSLYRGYPVYESRLSPE